MEENKQNSTINWYPGHMAKAKREMEEKIKYVDMVIELRDARIPLSSENPLIKQISNNKPTLIILSKKDKAEAKQTAKWIQYFQNNGYKAIALDLLKDNISSIVTKACLELMANKINKLKAKGMRNVEIKAMVVGIPNVGKSTLINSFAKKKMAKTSDKPGVTRNLQWIKISKEISLLDTPGVLWPKLENQNSAYLLAVTKSINDDILPIDEVVQFAIDIMIKKYPSRLEERYSIKVGDDVYKTIDDIAISRSCLIKDGEIDYKRVYSLILKEIRDGQLGALTLENYEDIQ